MQHEFIMYICVPEGTGRESTPRDTTITNTIVFLSGNRLIIDQDRNGIYHDSNQTVIYTFDSDTYDHSFNRVRIVSSERSLRWFGILQQDPGSHLLRHDKVDVGNGYG